MIRVGKLSQISRVSSISNICMKIISDSENKTFNIGKQISALLQEGDIICLFGNLGSGKTVLAKGIACGLGISGNQIISPTFVLIRRHSGRIKFNHLDLYRLKSIEQIIKLGYEEYFYGRDITVVEWAERLGFIMPKEFLRINIAFGPKNKRIIRLIAFGGRYKNLLEKINENIGN